MKPRALPDYVHSASDRLWPGSALDSMFVAFPFGKPVSTFPGNALVVDSDRTVKNGRYLPARLAVVGEAIRIVRRRCLVTRRRLRQRATSRLALEARLL